MSRILGPLIPRLRHTSDLKLKLCYVIVYMHYKSVTTYGAGGSPYTRVRKESARRLRERGACRTHHARGPRPFPATTRTPLAHPQP